MTNPLRELKEFNEISEYLEKPFACCQVTGCVDSQKLHFIDGLGEGFKYRIIVTYSDLRAKEIYEDYKFYDDGVIMPGGSLTLQATVWPSNASNKTVNWELWDDHGITVAKLSTSGVLTIPKQYLPKSGDQVTVRARSVDNPSKYDDYDVSILPKAEKLSIDLYSIYGQAGATIDPKTETVKSVHFLHNKKAVFSSVITIP